MNTGAYRIADEPAPGALAHLAVNPLWPLISVMFGGVWLSWSWFVFNGIAVGSPTRKREWLWVGGGLAVTVLMFLALRHLVSTEVIEEKHIKYALLLLVVWKLGVTYVLFTLQNHSIEIYEYYGGKLRNGVYVMVAAYFVSPKLMDSMPAFLQILVS